MYLCNLRSRTQINCRTSNFNNYRVEASKKIVEARPRGKQTVKGQGNNEAQIKRRRRRRDHAKGILNSHEKQHAGCEYTRYRVVPHHTQHILRFPSHEISLLKQPTFVTRIYLNFFHTGLLLDHQVYVVVVVAAVIVFGFFYGAVGMRKAVTFINVLAVPGTEMGCVSVHW